MDDRIMQFRVGVMALATLLIAAILLVMFGELPSFARSGYKVKVLFDSAPGVRKDTPVLKSGIRIGRVSDVRFADDDRKVQVTIEIDRDRQLYNHDLCQVSDSLLGDTSLRFVRAEVDDPRPVEDGEVLNGLVASDPTGLGSMLNDPIQTVTTTGNALAEASFALKEAANEITALVQKNEQGVSQTIGKAQQTLETVEQFVHTMNAVVGTEENQQKLRESLDRLPDTLDKMHSTMSLAAANLENLQKFTAPLGEGGADRVERLDRMLVTAGNMLEQFHQRLNSNDSTIGRLMSDDELYHHINRTAANVEQITRQLQPIIADVRVFTDKIARHPEQLGVRGAMSRSPGLK